MRAVQIDNVTESVGPFYYCDVEIVGQPVEELIDSGSSATAVTFSLYHRISRNAKLLLDILEKPNVILRDYNQHPLRIGAVAKLEVACKGKKVLTPVYINADFEHKPSESCIIGTYLLFI
uniref:Aspartic peptidase DDI1-type domain-containing protein n=1 Tax=Amphimedon queenslandica TaxID=400682 RepID=A0A1X7T0Y8_AMPQE